MIFKKLPLLLGKVTSGGWWKTKTSRTLLGTLRFNSVVWHYHQFIGCFFQVPSLRGGYPFLFFLQTTELWIFYGNWIFWGDHFLGSISNNFFLHFTCVWLALWGAAICCNLELPLIPYSLPLWQLRWGKLGTEGAAGPLAERSPSKAGRPVPSSRIPYPPRVSPQGFFAYSN